jgi:hypothetical protein
LLGGAYNTAGWDASCGSPKLPQIKPDRNDGSLRRFQFIKKINGPRLERPSSKRDKSAVSFSCVDENHMSNDVSFRWMGTGWLHDRRAN